MGCRFMEEGSYIVTRRKWRESGREEGNVMQLFNMDFRSGSSH